MLIALVLSYTYLPPAIYFTIPVLEMHSGELYTFNPEPILINAPEYPLELRVSPSVPLLCPME